MTQPLLLTVVTLLVSSCSPPPTRQIPPLAENLRTPANSALVLMYSVETGREGPLAASCYSFTFIDCTVMPPQTRVFENCSCSKNSWSLRTAKPVSFASQPSCTTDGTITAQACYIASCTEGADSISCSTPANWACSDFIRGRNPFDEDWTEECDEL